MKTTKNLSLLLFAVVCFGLSGLLTGKSTNAQDAKKPYCTVASNNAQWFVWGSKNLDEACGKAAFTFIRQGHTIKKLWRNYYYTDRTNKAELACNDGTIVLRARGAEIFNQAANTRRIKGWSGCIVKVKN